MSLFLLSEVSPASTRILCISLSASAQKDHFMQLWEGAGVLVKPTLLTLSYIFGSRIMLYPGYTPINASEDLPIVLHYGIKFWVNHANGKWSFDKHWFRQFDPLKCPPWEDTDAEGR